MRKSMITAAAVAALCAPLAACSGGGGGTAPTQTPASTQPASAPPTAAHKTTPPPATHSATPRQAVPTHTASPTKHEEVGEGAISDGKYKVGTDLPAGTYKTKGPGSTDVLKSCYYERAKDDSGSVESILDNEIVSGPSRVTVSNGQYLTLSGGCFWQHVL